jgi:hypothetical protein
MLQRIFRITAAFEKIFGVMGGYLEEDGKKNLQVFRIETSRNFGFIFSARRQSNSF